MDDSVFPQIPQTPEVKTDKDDKNVKTEPLGTPISTQTSMSPQEMYTDYSATPAVKPTVYDKNQTLSQKETSPSVPKPEPLTPPPATELPQVASPQTSAQQIPSASATSTIPVTSLEDKMSGSSQKKGSGFKIFIIFAVIIIVIIYAVVTYLFIQNRKKGSTQTSTSFNFQNQSPPVTPTPEFRPEQIKIQNGSVVRERSGGDIQVVIDKEDYEKSVSITGFAKVSVSPDTTKICFESWPPAPEPALYWSNLDGTEVLEISPNRQNCMWSYDSKSIFSVNSAPLSNPVNIFKYELLTETEQNLTSASVPESVVRRYDIVGLSGDLNRVICQYKNITSSNPVEKEGEEGDCEIDLSSGEVNHIPVE